MNNTVAFLELIRVGLWENCEYNGLSFMLLDNLDWDEVYRLASEQSVLGLVLAGLDYLPNELKPLKVVLLQWIGEIGIPFPTGKYSHLQCRRFIISYGRCFRFICFIENFQLFFLQYKRCSC